MQHPVTHFAIQLDFEPLLMLVMDYGEVAQFQDDVLPCSCVEDATAQTRVICPKLAISSPPSMEPW
jgi:hypothetical protein